MQKIYINKETNLVEQILKVKSPSEFSDEYFETCYSVLDTEDKVKGYNLRYNKEAEEFEIVEGMEAVAEVVVIEKEETNELKKLKKENEELKDRLERIENTINRFRL